MTETKLYQKDANNSGVWQHSRDAEHDLSKRYVFEVSYPDVPGWVAVKSEDDRIAAHMLELEDGYRNYDTRVWDQFENKQV